MKIAACSSITLARLARLASAAIRSRSTAAVESRSSHSADRQRGQLREVAGEGAGRLRARTLAAVHVDRQAEHEADRAPLRREREQSFGVGGEGLAAIVVTPVARRRSGSLAATPMVLVPRSSPSSAPRAGRGAATSMSGAIVIRLITTRETAPSKKFRQNPSPRQPLGNHNSWPHIKPPAPFCARDPRDGGRCRDFKRRTPAPAWAQYLICSRMILSEKPVPIPDRGRARPSCRRSARSPSWA